MGFLIFFIYFLSSISFAEESVPLQQLLDTSATKSLAVQSQSLDTVSKSRLKDASTAFANPIISLETQKGLDNTGMPIHNLKASLLQPISAPWSMQLKKQLATSTLAISEHHLEDQTLMTKVNVLKMIFEYTAKSEVLKSMELRSARFRLLQKYISTRPHLTPQKSAESLIVSNKIMIIERDVAMAKVHLENLWSKMNVLLDWSPRETFPKYKVRAPLNIQREELFQKLQKQNHDIELAHLELTHSEQLQKMESLQKYPDFALSANQVKGRSGNPEDNYSLGVNLSVPLFNLNRNKTKAAEYTVMSSEKKAQQVRQEVVLAFNETFQNYQVLKEFMVKHPISQLPKVHKELDDVLSGFKRGQVDLLTLFEADASSFERIQQIWSLQSEYVSTIADLSFLTGEILMLEVQP